MPLSILGISVSPDEDLLAAIDNKDVTTFQSVVDTKKIDLNKGINKAGDLNYLHLAIALEADPEIVKYICSQGVNPNATFEYERFDCRKYGYTAVMLFARKAPVRPQTTKHNLTILFEYGASFDLYEGSDYAHPEVIQLFKVLSSSCLELYALCRTHLSDRLKRDIDSNTWFDAIDQSNYPAVVFLVETCGINVNLQEDKYGFDALYYISGKKSAPSEQIFDYLLSKGADPNHEIRTSRGSMSPTYSTAFLSTINSNQLRNFKVLIEQGKAKLTTRALAIAAANHRAEMCRILISQGVAADQEYYGKSALRWALDSRTSDTDAQLQTIAALNEQATPRMSMKCAPR